MKTARSRRGGLTLEAILIILLLLIATLASFQFGFAMVVRQTAEHAATVAAREAAKGADADELEQVVNAVFVGHAITVGNGLSFVLESGSDTPVLRGDISCNPPAPPLSDGNQVRVTVCVSLDQRPLINPLGAFGITLAGRGYQVSSLVRKENP